MPSELSFARDEEIPGLDLARVVVHAGDLESLGPRGYVQSTRNLACDVRDVHAPTRRSRAAAHDAGSNTKRTELPFGTAEPGCGF
jgi:hypothetical protein